MVGGRAVDELLQRKCQVHRVARFRDRDVRAKLQERGVSTHPFDVTKDDPASLPDVDVVFLECWDPTHPDLTWTTDFTGMARLADRYAGQALIVNGATGSVYAVGDLPPQKETDLPQPVGEYALARFAQEAFINHVCKERGSPGDLRDLVMATCGESSASTANQSISATRILKPGFRRPILRIRAGNASDRLSSTGQGVLQPEGPRSRLRPAGGVVPRA